FGYSANWSIDNPKFALSATAGDSVRVRQVVPLATGNETATLTVTYKKAGAADIVKTVSIKGVIGVPDFATFAKVGVDTAGGYTLDRGYLQTADFAMADNITWMPIGDVTVPFSGTYDGGGYAITGGKNMTWKSVAVDIMVGVMAAGSGLFGQIDGSVRNMTLNNVTVNITENATFVCVGAVAAFSDGAMLEHINVNNVNLTLTNGTGRIYMGGAFGVVYNITIINDCAVNGSITGNATNTSNGFSYMGGLAGILGDFNVKNSVANVDITDNSAGYIYTGGFVGRAYRGKYVGNRCSGKINITQSAAGNISNLSVGGFAGELSDGNCVQNNISSNVITFGSASYTAGNTKVGGFMGWNETTPAASYSNNTYLGTVGANGYFKDQVALRAGSGSNPNITDDAQIR
ncbi:MAG: hypothetical protein RSC25_08225, partial [Christensenella sp.]